MTCHFLFAEIYTGAESFYNDILRENGIKRIAMAELFRSQLPIDTELTREIKASIDKGKIVPNQLTIRLIEQELKKEDTNVVISGFPRTALHFDLFVESLEKLNINIGYIWHLKHIDKEKAVYAIHSKNGPKNEKYDISFASQLDKFNKHLEALNSIVEHIKLSYPIEKIEIDIRNTDWMNESLRNRMKGYFNMHY